MNPKESAELASIMTTTEKDTSRALRQNRTIAFALHHASAAQDRVDRLKARLSREGVGFACRRGCAYCCTLRVESLPQETFRIARELSRRSNTGELIKRLTNYSSKVAGLRAEQHYEPCPFLVNSECSIYSIRPVMCRKYNSLDVEACKQIDTLVPEYGEMTLRASAIITGTVRGYGRANLPSEPHEIGQGVLRALTDPTAKERWFKGEAVFDSLPESSR